MAVRGHFRVQHILNTNENTSNQTLYDTVKALFTRKRITLNAHVSKRGKLQINKLSIHLKLERKQLQERKIKGQFHSDMDAKISNKILVIGI